MHFFKAIALSPLAVQAAVVARQDCDGTATVTVTPSPITQIDEIYTNAATATTTATRYALLSSSASPSAAAAEEKKLRVRQCPSPTTTTTLTAAAETITHTSTVTYTKPVRATATAAACQASNNYGLVHGTLNIQQQGPLPQVQRFADIESVEACCTACFQSEQGCMAWSFGGSVSNGAAEAGCVMSLVSSGCPSSAGSEVIVYENADKPLVAIGGCDVQVKAF